MRYMEYDARQNKDVELLRNDVNGEALTWVMAGFLP